MFLSYLHSIIKEEREIHLWSAGCETYTKSYYSHHFIRKPFETLVQSDTGQGVCDLQVDWVVLDSVQSQLCINLQKEKLFTTFKCVCSSLTTVRLINVLLMIHQGNR